jgi:hypothetical protein
MADSRPETSSTSTAELRTRGTTTALCYGLLGPPLAMLTNLLATYALTPRACTEGSLLLHLISLAMLIVSAAGGAFAWRTWQLTGSSWPDETGGTVGRSRFMAVLGMLTSVFFSVIIAWQWMPHLFLSPCQ